MALGGALIINNQQEVNKAITNFKLGQLFQLIDLDENMVSFLMAHHLWMSLCVEQLTGLLWPSSPFPAMTLHASSLLDKDDAIEVKLYDAKNIVKEL